VWVCACTVSRPVPHARARVRVCRGGNAVLACSTYDCLAVECQHATRLAQHEGHQAKEEEGGQGGGWTYVHVSVRCFVFWADLA